jgi:hypothetical protein
MNQELEKDLLFLIKNLVTFPFPQICVHLIAFDILEVLSKYNPSILNKEELQNISNALVKSSAGDDKVIDIINSVI